MAHGGDVCWTIVVRDVEGEVDVAAVLVACMRRDRATRGKGQVARPECAAREASRDACGGAFEHADERAGTKDCPSRNRDGAESQGFGFGRG